MRRALFHSALTLSLLLSLFSLKAQEEGFNRTYHTPPQSGGVAHGLLELDSSYLILCGIDTNLLDQYGRALMFMELDWSGDTIRTNKLVGGKVGNWWGGTYESLVEAPDSGYYLVGGYEDTGSGDAAVLYRIGPDLDTMWTRFYGADDTLWNKFTAIEPLPSGNFLITGERGDTAYGNRAWYLKVDPQGQVIWEQKIGAQNDNDFGTASIQRTMDGGFIAGGGLNHTRANSGPVC